jgi:hypothetical protein
LQESRLSLLAPRPGTVQQTGLSVDLLGDLTAKHLLGAGVLTFSELTSRLGLAGPVIEEVVNFLRREARIEVRPRSGDDPDLRYGLTDRGRAGALDAMYRGGYVGPAPVLLTEYSSLARRQTVHQRHVTRESMQRAFAGIVISEARRDRLGTALNSGRAIFIYGDSGTGKTYIAQRLKSALPGAVLIPHAILVNDTIIQLYDPAVHRQVDREPRKTAWLLAQGFDARYIACERPLIVTGGELTADMLDVQTNHDSREYIAPLQLKANNGVLVIDDLGRQRIATDALFNRWIVPMEERVDHLATSHGAHFEVPFDVVLVFATNLEPRQLADEAFLRRIGYKIHFTPVTADEYRRIWRSFCEERGIAYDEKVVNYTINHLHARDKLPLLPCHPRDLLSMALDQQAYNGNPSDIDEGALDWAWDNYFLHGQDDSN